MKRLRPGARLGAYRLVERLGTGATAEVWKAVADGPAGFQRTVVLKRPLPELAQDGGFVQCLVEEARLLAALDHPNVVRLFALEELGGVLTIVSEHVHGRDLRTLLAAQAPLGPPEPGLAAQVVRDLCRALAGAHAAGIVHRDVSPANVLVGYAGVVKLFDFGLAKALAGAGASETRTGALKGNLAYMAPEQLAGQAPSPLWDVYAAGVVLHETLTAKRLFKGRADPGTMAALRRTRVAPPSQTNPRVPPELDAICARAMAYAAEERFQDAEALAQALDGVVAALGATPAAVGRWLAERVPEATRGAPAEAGAFEAERQTKTAARRAPRPPLWVGLAVAAALILGGVLWIAGRRAPAPTRTSTATRTSTPTRTSTQTQTSTPTSTPAPTADSPPPATRAGKKAPGKRAGSKQAPDLTGGSLLDPFGK